MKKTIVITEEMSNSLYDTILNETFYPGASLVLLVKEYLDANFARQNMDDIDENGFPKVEKTVSMLLNGQPVKTMKPGELLLLLDDVFHNKIKDDKDRKKFLKQVIKDWYNNEKGLKTGILTVNYL